MGIRRLIASVSLVVLAVPGVALAQVHPKQVLTGYKCMMLARQWDGEGPMPPPVPVYSGSRSSRAEGRHCWWHSDRSRVYKRDGRSHQYDLCQWPPGLDRHVADRPLACEGGPGGHLQACHTGERALRHRRRSLALLCFTLLTVLGHAPVRGRVAAGADLLGSAIDAARPC